MKRLERPTRNLALQFDHLDSDIIIMENYLFDCMSIKRQDGHNEFVGLVYGT